MSNLIAKPRRLQRIAHEKVEEQRGQLQEQEKQVAHLRARIALLEGTSGQGHGMRINLAQQNTVDDFSIKVRSNLSRDSDASENTVVLDCCFEGRARDQPMGS